MNRYLAALGQAAVRAIQGAHQGYKTGTVTRIFPPISGELLRIAYGGPGDLHVYAHTVADEDSPEHNAEAISMTLGAGMALTKHSLYALQWPEPDYFGKMMKSPMNVYYEAISKISREAFDNMDSYVDPEVIKRGLVLRGAIPSPEETGEKSV